MREYPWMGRRISRNRVPLPPPRVGEQFGKSLLRMSAEAVKEVAHTAPPDARMHRPELAQAAVDRGDTPRDFGKIHTLDIIRAIGTCQ